MKKTKQLLTALVLILLIGGAFANIVASAEPSTQEIKVTQPSPQSIDPPLP